MRKAVAEAWLLDVREESGPDYEMAVRWTLKEAPHPSMMTTTTKNMMMIRQDDDNNDNDDGWRDGFAQNVAQPLKRCYDALHSTA